MSTREGKIQAEKRAQYQEKRQHRRIVDQLNRLQSAGYTPEDIKAAGPNAWETLQGWNLVKDKQTGQWVSRDGSTPTATPGAVTNPNNPYAQATSAPAWAQKSLTGPAQTATPFNQAINALVNREEAGPVPWRQQGTPTQPQAGAPKVMPRPTEARDNPFAGVTGTAGTSQQPTPTVPAWLSGVASAAGGRQGQKTLGGAIQGISTVAGPGVLEGAASVAQGTGNPQWWQSFNNPSTPTTPGAQTGTKGGRHVDPLTGIPDFPMLSSMGTAPTTYGGYGSSWYKGYRRGGGGRGRSWTPFPRYPRGGGRGRGNAPFVPSSGLANWSIG